MKTNQKWILLLSSILFLAISACEEKSKDKKEEPQQEEPEMVKAPDGIITLDEAKILCDNYETRRISGIKEFEMAQNPEAEFVPTQAINFDFKTIKKYVKYIERQAKKAKVKPDSLRIYLANYGKDGKDPNRNTVFILPTASINGEHGGFYIDANGDAKLIRNYWPKSGDENQEGSQKAQAAFFPTLHPTPYQNGSLILNDGHSSPPPPGDF
jgi:hypothetical protein